MKNRLLIALVLALLPSAAVAQGVGPDDALRDGLAWSPSHQAAADKVSTGLVIAGLALPCLIDRTSRCVANEGLRVGIGVTVAEVVKRTTHRKRPNGVDDKSFFSEHTLLACVATYGTKVWAICPSVGYLRLAADWHWSSDVLTGAAVAGVLMTVHF